MLRSRFYFSLVLAFLATGAVASPVYLIDDFESYPNGGQAGSWFNGVDSTWEFCPVNVWDLSLPDANNPGNTVDTTAAYFRLDSGEIDNVFGDWVSFEHPFTAGPEAFGPNPNQNRWIELDIAIVESAAYQALNDGVPLVEDIYTYLYVDSDGDGWEDVYYEASIGVEPQQDLLQTYPKRWMMIKGGPSPDLWDVWTYDDDPEVDDWVQGASSYGVPLNHLNGLTSVGIGFLTGAFTDPGGTLATLWIDNYILIPEPSSIALLGLAGLALLRRRL